MAQQKTFTLYNPQTGEKYEAGSQVEATRLKAHGYTDKPAKAAAAKPDKS